MFLLWGLWHGLFLTLERLLGRVSGGSGGAAPRPLPVLLVSRAYATAVFLFGWLLFRSETFGALRAMLRSLAGAAPDTEARALYIDASPGLLALVVVGLVLSQPGLLPRLRPTATPYPGPRSLLAQWALLSILGLLSILFVAGGSYNSFIYFRF